MSSSSSSQDESRQSVGSHRDGGKLWTAIQIADVIRRHEVAHQAPQQPAAAAASQKDDPLHPLRTFLETPGVQQATVALVACLTFAIPTRRFVLHRADRYWKLGTIFPDLIVTPTLAIATAQCTLYVGSVYGSMTYLNRLAQVASTNSTRSPPSSTLNAICNDPVVIAATNENAGNESFQSNITHSSSFNDWDPRYQAVLALEKALQACRETRQSETTDEPSR
jgi:hypothetical protein